jgi:TatA/E family protein of Tat protein translocase
MEEKNMIGITEWIVIGTVLVLLFGASQIKKWAKALGQAKRDFQDAQNEILGDKKEQ